MLNNENAPLAQSKRHHADEAILPLWSTARDGRSVRLVEDDQLAADFEAWRRDACDHAHQFTGKTINAGGAECFRRYCRTCGIATTNFLPHRTVEGTTITVVDPDARRRIEDAYGDKRRIALDAIVRRAADRQQGATRDSYGRYLLSPEWRDKRRRVMKRAGGVCEGCLDRAATQVHHLSYAHVRDEFAFELVAICDACHVRLHAVEQQDAAE